MATLEKVPPYGSQDGTSEPSLEAKNGSGDLVPPPGVDEAKLLRKIDLRLIPTLCILYLLAFLDRVNISNAAIFGLRDDLKLDGVKYNTALTIFFVPYILFEIPSNVLLKKLKPHLWLSGCMFMFGLVTMLQGFVQNYAGLLTTRFFLGVFEAGMFPGCFYLIGMWYKRTEVQKRISFFFSSTSLAGAFGGLIAAAIGKMDGLQGYRGWRWIFILEGLLTVLVSFGFYFIISDFPEEAKFLTDDERAFVKARLRADVGDSARDEKMGFREVLQVFRDYKIFLGGLMYFGLIVPAYGYAYFAPTIVQQLGNYSSIRTQLMSVPPWVAAFLVSMLIAYFSDRLRHRFTFIVLPISLAVVGLSLLVSLTGHSAVRYFALFLTSSGCYSAMPVIVCWFTTNLGGHHRRAVGTAWQVAFGNIGGIIATYSFIATDAPRYIRGYSIALAMVGVALLSCTAFFFAVVSENRKRDKGTSKWSDVDEYERLSPGEKAVRGDLAPHYRYMT